MATGTVALQINPPDLSTIDVTTLTSGTAQKVTSVGAWYCVRAINGASSGSCYAFILDSNNDKYLGASIGTMSSSTFIRASTAWLYFPKGAEFYARAAFTDSSASGLLCAKPL